MLADLRLRGIPRVTKVYIKKQKTNIWTSNGALGNGEEWVLETDGTNLATVLADPDVDCTRTVSNDIVEICSVRLAASHVVSSASPCGCRAHGRAHAVDATYARYAVDAIFNTGHGHRGHAASFITDAAGGHFVRRRLRELSALGRAVRHHVLSG